MDPLYVPPYPLSDILFYQDFIGLMGLIACWYAIVGSGFSILVKPSTNRRRRYSYLVFGQIVLIALPVWGLCNAGWTSCIQLMQYYWYLGGEQFRLDVVFWWIAVVSIPVNLLGILWIHYWPNRIERRVASHARKLHRENI